MVPTPLADALCSLNDTVRADLEGLERRFDSAEDRRETPIQPRRREIADMVSALHALTRNDEDQSRARTLSNLREHLAWMSKEQPEQLISITNEIDSFSGEALAVIAAVAMDFPAPTLRDAVTRLIRESPTLRTIWRAHLQTRVSVLSVQEIFSEPLAAASSDLLLQALTELQSQLLDLRRGDTWQSFKQRSVQANEQVRQELVRLAAAIRSLEDQLQ